MTESKRTEPGLGKRVVISTTVSQKTHDFFSEHAEFVVGRSLDLWVTEQLGKELEERQKAFEKMVEALEVGGCSCGRVLRVRKTKEGEARTCPACSKAVADCDCPATKEMAQRQLLDWQRIRSEAGLETNGEDILAKKLELGLSLPTEKEEARRKRERELSAKRSAAALQAAQDLRQGPAIVRPKD
jgi:hypothetical protein